MRTLRKTFFLTALAVAFGWIGLREASGAEVMGVGKPEKSRLEVAIAAIGPLYLPLLVAQEAGYFSKHGLSLSISQVSATASAQALISGKVDMYQGGAAAITANLAGTDITYVAAAVDRSTLVLFGQKGLTSFESLRGKSVATTSPGAFGELAIRRTAKGHGMELGKDIKLLYHRGPPEAFATFVAGNADGLVVTPPQSDVARNKGYPVIIDYYERGLRIIGPGMAVTRELVQKYPNSIRAYLMGYLDGVKRAIEDPSFAMKVHARHNKISDAKVLEESYQQGVKVWNKDMTVDPEAIRVVLEESAHPKAKEADPRRFYDNSLIQGSTATTPRSCFPER